MKFKELGVSDSFLWFFICSFFVFWLGDQLIGALLHLEILNIRVTNMISFEEEPFWFIFVSSFKFAFWCFSILVVFKYIQSKLRKKGT
ncbi:hypothetical protein XM47_10890 [Catenovulum maritimum]|uniref:Uncharacterized protein n=1 Tax=Catenovulum maritimum TaxID=1513271 RepID=A0A0J8GQG7_9ALTE|nr:hypothetical protein XM47_10890 [Catenovulum maritimum]